MSLKKKNGVERLFMRPDDIVTTFTSKRQMCFPSESFVIYISVTLLFLCSGEGPSLCPDQQGEEVKDHGNSAQT